MMPDDLAVQIADARAKRDALPRHSEEWYQANRMFYELAQAEIAQRRNRRTPPGNGYAPIKEQGK